MHKHFLKGANRQTDAVLRIRTFSKLAQLLRKI